MSEREGSFCQVREGACKRGGARKCEGVAWRGVRWRRKNGTLIIESYAAVTRCAGPGRKPGMSGELFTERAPRTPRCLRVVSRLRYLSAYACLYYRDQVVPQLTS